MSVGTDSICVLTRALDNIAERKSDESDPFIMGCLAAVEDAIEERINDIRFYSAAWEIA